MLKLQTEGLNLRSLFQLMHKMVQLHHFMEKAIEKCYCSNREVGLSIGNCEWRQMRLEKLLVPFHNPNNLLGMKEGKFGK